MLKRASHPTQGKDWKRYATTKSPFTEVIFLLHNIDPAVIHSYSPMLFPSLEQSTAEVGTNMKRHWNSGRDKTAKILLFISLSALFCQPMDATIPDPYPTTECNMLWFQHSLWYTMLFVSNDWVQHAMVSAQSMLYYVICIQRLSGTCYSFSLYVILCGLYPTTEYMRYGFSTVYVILCCLHPTTGPNVPWFQSIWLYYVICIKRLSAMWYGFSTVYVILCRLYSTTERNVLWFQSICYTMLFVSYNWPQRAMVSAQSICCTIGRLYPTEASEQSIRYIMLSVSNDREVHPPNLFGGCCHHQSLIQVCCGTWIVIPSASRWLAVQDTIIQNL